MMTKVDALCGDLVSLGSGRDALDSDLVDIVSGDRVDALSGVQGDSLATGKGDALCGDSRGRLDV